MSEEQRQLFDRILEIHQQFRALKIEYWKKYEVFEPQWWFLLAVLIIPWIVWWILVDKKRLGEIVLFGLFIALTATLLDAIGNELTLWAYPHVLFPYVPRLCSVDFSLLPVMFMLIYQYFPKWKTFIGAITLVAAAGSFLAEPLFILMSIYEPHEWRVVYSFPVYIIIAIVFKWIVSKIKTQG